MTILEQVTNVTYLFTCAFFSLGTKQSELFTLNDLCLVMDGHVNIRTQW